MRISGLMFKRLPLSKNQAVQWTTSCMQLVLVLLYIGDPVSSYNRPIAQPQLSLTASVTAEHQNIAQSQKLHLHFATQQCVQHAGQPAMCACLQMSLKWAELALLFFAHCPSSRSNALAYSSAGRRALGSPTLALPCCMPWRACPCMPWAYPRCCQMPAPGRSSSSSRCCITTCPLLTSSL